MEVIDENPHEYEYGLPPLLIPPVNRVVPRRLWSQSYSCFVTQEGVIHFRDTTTSGAEFVADIETHLPLSPMGTPHQRDRKTRTPPDAWFRAQCAFRGLNPNGDLEAVQNLLRRGGHFGMTLELKKGQAETVRKYVTANKNKAEKEWVRLGDNLRAKAEFWPRRLLIDSFFSSPLPTPVPTVDSSPHRHLRATGRDVLRIEVQDWSIFQHKFKRAVEGLLIHHEIVRMHCHRGGEHLLVVGVNKDDVTGEYSVLKEGVRNGQVEVEGKKEGTKSSAGIQRRSASPPSTRL